MLLVSPQTINMFQVREEIKNKLHAPLNSTNDLIRKAANFNQVCSNLIAE